MFFQDHAAAQNSNNLLQAFQVGRILWNYLIPLAVFAYCYGRIFHTIRRQNKVVTDHAGRGCTMGAAQGNQVSGQAQQQGTAAAAAGGKLSHTEMNVLKTMITVIVVFVVFWFPLSLGTFLFLFEVSVRIHKT